MDIPIEWVYAVAGFLIGLILTGSNYSHSIALCHFHTGNVDQLILVEENGKTHISQDWGNTWARTGKWK